jgi:hypothetical protein
MSAVGRIAAVRCVGHERRIRIRATAALFQRGLNAAAAQRGAWIGSLALDGWLE